MPILLEQSPDRAMLLRDIRKQLKRLRDEKVDGVHAGIVTQATRAAIVS